MARSSAAKRAEVRVRPSRIKGILFMEIALCNSGGQLLVPGGFHSYCGMPVVSI